MNPKKNNALMVVLRKNATSQTQPCCVILPEQNRRTEDYNVFNDLASIDKRDRE